MPRKTKRISDNAKQSAKNAAERKEETQATSSLVGTFAFIYRLHRGARSLIKLMTRSNK